MRIGVPREIKDREFRVGLMPSSVAELVRAGHEVVVERGAGAGAGLTDESYRISGAELRQTADEVFGEAKLVVKVKEPQAAEIARLRRGQALFTYLHLAADRTLTDALMASGATCIAYETVTAPGGGLPLLAPMSEVAGRLAPQVGAHYLQKSQGGRGVLLGGVPGVPPADVVILGAGVVGSNAAAIAIGMGASVTVADRNPDALRRLEFALRGRARTIFSTYTAIAELIKRADLVVGAVLTPGAAAPKIVSRAMLGAMNQGAVIVDVAVDQGGCCETTRPTSHSAPTYVVDGVIHYCVTNMPGATPRTSTFALNNATLPFTLALAGKGWRRAMQDDPHLRAGLNLHDGAVYCAGVAEAFGLRLSDAAVLTRA